MRPLIALLLILMPVLAGCDRQSVGNGQATPTPETNASAAAGSESASPYPGLDRSHRGEAAPDIAFLDPGDKQVSLADFRGKPLILNLWATWCAPCVKEMPTLDVLASQLGDKAQVVVLAQEPTDGREKVGAFFKKAGFKYLQPYLDADAAFSLGLGLNLPTTIAYDSMGRELWRLSGTMDWAGPDARALIDEAR